MGSDRPIIITRITLMASIPNGNGAGNERPRPEVALNIERLGKLTLNLTVAVPEIAVPAGETDRLFTAIADVARRSVQETLVGQVSRHRHGADAD
jgi:hypothetical protein